MLGFFSSRATGMVSSDDGSNIANFKGNTALRFAFIS